LSPLEGEGPVRLAAPQVARHVPRLDLDDRLEPVPPAAEDVKPMIDRAIEWFAGEVIEPDGRTPERTRG
jgi:hypothetical protein